MQNLTEEQLEKFQNNHFEVEGVLTFMYAYMRLHSRAYDDKLTMSPEDFIEPAHLDRIMSRVIKIRNKNYDIVVDGI